MGRGTSITGGGVTFPIGADLTPLKRGLEQAKQDVKQAVQQMTNATTNVSINAPTDLGGKAASASREGNIVHALNDLVRKQERMAERQVLRDAAVARYQQSTGLTIRDRGQIGFERDLARQRGSEAHDNNLFQQFIAERNARSIFTGSRDAPSMDALEEAGRFEAKAGRKQAGQSGGLLSTLASNSPTMSAILRYGTRYAGLGVAGLAVGLADHAAGIDVANRRAVRDFGEAHSFLGRNQYNDSVIGGTAAAMGSRSLFSDAMEKVPIVGRYFVEAIEKMTHAASRAAESYQVSIQKIYSASAGVANAQGRPMEALAISTQQAMEQNAGEFNVARRAALDAEQAAQSPFLFDFTGRAKAAAEKGAGAANIAAKKAQRAYGAKLMQLREEGQINIEQRQGYLDSIYGRAGEAYTRSKAADLELGGDSYGAFTMGLAAEGVALKTRHAAELAGKRGPEAAAIKLAHARENAQFFSERDVRIRDFAYNNEGTYTSEGMAGGQGEIGAFQKIQFDQLKGEANRQLGSLPDYSAPIANDTKVLSDKLDEIKTVLEQLGDKVMIIGQP